jgi:hypothetical protein
MKKIILLCFVFVLNARADQLPKAADGFAWKEFSRELVVIQVPFGWHWREIDHHPARAVIISPNFDERGSYDSGFTLNTVVCHNEKEWNDAYSSALKFFAKAVEGIKALGKPTFEKEIQGKDMQVLIIEGDTYLPTAPHPKEKYRVRTIIRTMPKVGLVYVYTMGALEKDWDEMWKTEGTMLEPLIFQLPDEKD